MQRGISGDPELIVGVAEVPVNDPLGYHLKYRSTGSGHELFDKLNRIWDYTGEIRLVKTPDGIGHKSNHVYVPGGLKGYHEP